eukprot:CCRYP_010262-RE/>CCRYP_010262-RE protein AED:0.42 eAED:0.47 QI:0/0/0/1/0/0/3/0/317
MPATPCGIGSVAVWNSGILLTRLLDKINQQEPSILYGKTIVELGCGTALASIAAAKLGASTVHATDANPEVLNLAQRNIDRNNASRAKAAILQWGLLDAFDFERCADVIIGSDLTYNPNTWRALAESMVTILKPGGTVIYLTLGHSGFNVGGELSGFAAVAENVGLQKVTSGSNISVGGNSIESLLPQVLNEDEKKVIDANGGRKSKRAPNPTNTVKILFHGKSFGPLSFPIHQAQRQHKDRLQYFSEFLVYFHTECPDGFHYRILLHQLWSHERVPALDIPLQSAEAHHHLALETEAYDVGDDQPSSKYSGCSRFT